MKVQDIVVLREVADDLNDGKDFYELRESGVGDYFWDSLIADIKSLIIYAGIHHREHSLYRMLAKRFPYAVYYEIVNDIVRIVDVLPMRQNPSWIKGTLKGRG